VVNEPGTSRAAYRAAGLVIAAVDGVLSQSSEPPAASEAPPRRAFAMVRPPGHHAESDSTGGFCLFNNVMVGVAHAQAVHGLGRVAVLDFDVHHGNGGSDISWCDATRLYASSFEGDVFGGGGIERGCDGMHGQIVSCPLSAGCGSEEFRAAWADELLPAVRAFEPDAIFLAAGFDGHADDPLASVQLHEDDFAWLTAEVAKIASDTLPIISVLEGGYNVDALERCARAHVRALIHS
jgi:acetoin utilization deacetylase AcuC-like enzyme